MGAKVLLWVLLENETLYLKRDVLSVKDIYINLCILDVRGAY